MASCPTIPGSLRPTNYEAIVSRFNFSSDMYDGDQSLPGQLQRRQQEGVDSYLFTMFSAIPLADYVRGFYDETGAVVPQLGYIDVSRRLPTGDALAHHITEEAARLQPLLLDQRNICIIDEYANTHRSLNFGCKIVRLAKEPGSIEQLTTIAGSYYHETNHPDVDASALSSIHAEFLYEAGKLGAKSVARASLEVS